MSALKPYQRRALGLLYKARTFADADAVPVSRTTKVDDAGMPVCIDWRSVESLVHLGLAERVVGLNRARLTTAGYDRALQSISEQGRFDLEASS